MTRFDADTKSGRRELFADAVAAHRTRASAYLTIEVDETAVDATDGLDADLGIPWVQFADGVVNLDCTDAELDRLKGLVDEYPAFSIDELRRPDGADGIESVDGVNVRVRAMADEERLSGFVDAVFLDVYELPDDYRAWVVEV